MYEIFFYDDTTKLWGFSEVGFERLRDEVVPVMSRRAIEVRIQFARERELRESARRAVTGRGRDRLF